MPQSMPRTVYEGRKSLGLVPSGPYFSARRTDEADIADLRGILYGLHAILRLHAAQEDETYLSLGDTTDAGGLPPARGPHAAPGRLASGGQH
jgi:hypothetical protein